MSVPPTKDPALADHLAWLGYIQPEGLVVSAPALVDAQVVIDRAGLSDLQRRFAPFVSSLALTDSDIGDMAAGVAEVPRLLIDYLGWPADLLVGWDATRPLPPELTVSLPEFGETLAPTYAVTQPKAGGSPWLLLVKTHPATTDLDKPASSHERGWSASPAKKFERLLRETGVPIGLLTNGVSFQLVYAPPKENSGTLTFNVASMTEISGRLILGAFHLLLNSWTLLSAPSAAAPARPAPDQPQLPGLRLRKARRAGAPCPLRVAARLCRRRATGQEPAPPRSRRPPPRTFTAASSPCSFASSSCSSPRIARSSPPRAFSLNTIPCAVSSSACVPMPSATPIRWSTVSAHGRSSSRSSASSTAAASTRRCGCPPARAISSISIAYPFLEGRSHRDDPVAAHPARQRRRHLRHLGKPLRARRRARQLPHPRCRRNRLGLPDHHGLRCRGRRRHRHRPQGQAQKRGRARRRRGRSGGPA
jgi:hypothetical protein